jgi:hypothetical protein
MNENKIKRRWQREDEAAISDAIAALQQHRQGRKFLWWLLEIGGVGQQPYANNALQTSFNCGTLNVGNQILEALVATAPEGYLTMMKENADERTTRDAELGAARDAARGDAARGSDDGDSD